MATAVAPDIRDYADRLAGLPQNLFVGSLLWFEMTEDGGSSKVRVTRETLESWFMELGINTRFLPEPINKVNAYRRASSNAIKGRKYQLSPEESAELHVVEVKADTNEVVRQIQRRVRNSRTERVYEHTVGTIRFHKGPRQNRGGRRRSAERISMNVLDHIIELNLEGKRTGRTAPMTDLDRRHVTDALNDFEVQFDDLAVNYNADHVRKVLREILKHANAIQIRPAVYFIHTNRQHVVDQLNALIPRFGSGCGFHQLPLLDTYDQREMLVNAFQEQVQAEVDALLGDIAKCNEEAKTAGRQPSSQAYQTLYGTFSDIQERAMEYTRLLNLTQEKAGAALELALENLVLMSSGGLNPHESRGRKKKGAKNASTT